MKKYFILAVALMAMASCSTSKKSDFVVDEYGYATFEHQGFTFKIKEDVLETEEAQAAIAKMRADLDNIVSFCPADKLEVMRPNPIWMEENNPKNRSAAWYHWDAEWPGNNGDLAAKGDCLEITNYNMYVESSTRNQPLMVFHELCHLYHDQGMSEENRQLIAEAYRHARENDMYKGTAYRSRTDLPEEEWDYERAKNGAYCMNNDREFFTELSEAYWGDNDFYPFNYQQLKDYDPVAFAAIEKIWGPRQF